MSKYVRNKKKKAQYNGANVIVWGWAILMFSLFPLIFTDYYFNILQTKYVTYSSVTGVMLLALFIWGLMSQRLTGYWKEAKEKYSADERGWFAAWFKDRITFTDKCAMLFIVIAVISTLQAAPYIKQAFIGNEGRYTGLFLLLLYVSSYFCVSRFFKMKPWVITVFLWVGLFICIFGITDYFNMNIMHFRDRMQVKQYSMFCSTIGNINTYTTFVGFVLAISGVLFNSSKENKGRIIFYYICMIVSFVAIIMGQSDNGYLTLIAFFGLLPLATFKSRRGLRRYMLTLGSLLACIYYVEWVNVTYATTVAGLEGIFDIVIGFKYRMPITIAVWAITALLYIIDYKTKATEALLPKAVHTVWVVIVIAVAVTVIALLYIANFTDISPERWGSAGNYLVFSDNWGTKRGYIWRACLETYSTLPIIHKIFGTGPDTFGIYMMNYKYDEMVRITSQIFDSAHNEYLQYLFTIGPIGLVSYICLLGGNIKRAIKKACNSDNAPYLLAIAYLILCYATQATVNINLPISTPIMWAWMSIAAAMIRQED